MSESSGDPSGCAFLAPLSAIASTTGSILAAISYIAFARPLADGLGSTVWAFCVLFGFGIWITLPVGLIIGGPMLAMTRKHLGGHIEVATFAFAVTGLAFGALFPVENVELYFGGCVGAMHPLVLARANGLSWAKTVRAALISAAAVPSLAYATEDVSNFYASRTEFEVRCADRYGSMAVVAERSALGEPKVLAGKWYNQLKWRSLYEREDWLPIGNSKVLIARDYALIPTGLIGWLNGGREVKRHCLTEKKGSDAAMLRSRGFGRPPTLSNLMD